jgi:hypothetical protein
MTPTPQSQHTPVHKPANTGTHHQAAGDKDRALTDIGNTMFNSAIFGSNRQEMEEQFKTKWVHSTPEESGSKFNRIAPERSSLFEVKSIEDKENRPASLIDFGLQEKKGREGLREIDMSKEQNSEGTVFKDYNNIADIPSLAMKKKSSKPETASCSIPTLPQSASVAALPRPNVD